MRLTEQQINHFNTFGFVTFRQFLSADELKRINPEYNTALDSLLPPGTEFDGKERLGRAFVDVDTPLVAALGDDPRFADVAAQLLGKEAICIGIAGNYYVGDTRWHSDSRSLDYSGVKFTVYLDPLGATSGALRVIPGSHQEPLWSQSKMTMDTEPVFGVQPNEMPAYAFDSQPGDALVFLHPLWHSSFGGGSKRRMIEVNYYADPDTPEALEAFRFQMAQNHRSSTERGRQFYPNHWRSIDEPRHQWWIRRMAEIGVLDTPGVAPFDS
jgi:hypothetical protein